VTGAPPYHATILYLIRNLRSKVAELETTVLARQDPTRDFWDKVGIIMPVVTGLLTLFASLVLAGVAWLISGRVEQALRERQFQFENAKVVESSLERLGQGADAATTRRISVSLAGYGRYAIAPLIQAMQNAAPEQMDALADGLRAVGVTDRAAVCDQLRSVLGNRTKLYHLDVQRSAAQGLGDLNCQSASAPLQEYITRLQIAKESGDMSRLPFVPLAGTTAITDASIDGVLNTANSSLVALKEAEKDEK